MIQCYVFYGVGFRVFCRVRVYCCVLFFQGLGFFFSVQVIGFFFQSLGQGLGITDFFGLVFRIFLWFRVQGFGFVFLRFRVFVGFRVQDFCRVQGFEFFQGLGFRFLVLSVFLEFRDLGFFSVYSLWETAKSGVGGPESLVQLRQYALVLRQ